MPSLEDLRQTLTEIATMRNSEEYSLRIAATYARAVLPRLSDPIRSRQFIQNAIFQIEKIIGAYRTMDPNLDRLDKRLKFWCANLRPGPRRLDENPIFRRAHLGRRDVSAFTEEQLRRTLAYFHPKDVIDEVVKRVNLMFITVDTPKDQALIVSKIVNDVVSEKRGMTENPAFDNPIHLPDDDEVPGSVVYQFAVMHNYSREFADEMVEWLIPKSYRAKTEQDVHLYLMHAVAGVKQWGKVFIGTEKSVQPVRGLLMRNQLPFDKYPVHGGYMIWVPKDQRAEAKALIRDSGLESL